MKPACHADMHTATIRSTAPGGAMSTGRARLAELSTDRALPKAATRANIGTTDVGSDAT